MKTRARRSSDKVKTLPSLLAALSRDRKAGKKIVFTNGCFDILHIGHIRYLQKARSLGDRLVIGVNSDASVRRLKGPDRPVTRERDRAEVLAALECVDYAVLFSEDTPEALIRAVHPDLLVKGGDWKKSAIVGSAFVGSYGGKVRSLPFINGYSTTGLIQKIQTL